MKRNLISEWSVGEHSGRLFMIEPTKDNLQIILEANDDSHAGTVQFWWDESEALVQGITEILITTHQQLSEELIVGIMVSKNDDIFFGWTPDVANDECGLMLCQGEERIIIGKSLTVEFFRWLRNSLQLMGRIVS